MNTVKTLAGLGALVGAAQVFAHPGAHAHMEPVAGMLHHFSGDHILGTLLVPALIGLVAWALVKAR